MLLLPYFNEYSLPENAWRYRARICRLYWSREVEMELAGAFLYSVRWTDLGQESGVIPTAALYTRVPSPTCHNGDTTDVSNYFGINKSAAERLGIYNDHE